MMNWTTPIDLYCERLDPGFWAEPLNALSNLAFILAALWGWKTAHDQNETHPLVRVLLLMAGLVGVGSFLFHTFANSWSELADVVPIWSFVGVYVLTAMYLIGGMPAAKVLRIGAIVTVAVVLTITLLAMTNPADQVLISTAPSLLNGSGQYAPAVISLLVFAWVAWRRRLSIAPWIIAATLTFMASLVFRTLDLHLCARVPFGTHFLWHILNGLMLALLLQALIRRPR